MASTKPRKVVAISAAGRAKVYESLRGASRQTGASTSAIYNCCNEMSRTAHGYRWLYLDDFLDAVGKARGHE